VAQIDPGKPAPNPSAREPERSPATRGYGLEPAPWQRMLEETPKAYAAFCVFRDQGVGRSYAATARTLGKRESQVQRWATPFHWKERAHAWDVVQSRETELLRRQEREHAARRRMQHAEQLERIAMAGLLQLVARDPHTGEAKLSPLLTPPLLCRVYELALKISHSQAGAPAPDTSTSDTADPLPLLSDPELQRIIALAQERAEPKGEQEQ